MNQPSLSKSVTVLVKFLKEDADYREGWLANIAMAFSVAIANELGPDMSGELTPNDIHRLSNKAANDFINRLCTTVEHSNLIEPEPEPQPMSRIDKVTFADLFDFTDDAPLKEATDAIQALNIVVNQMQGKLEALKYKPVKQSSFKKDLLLLAATGIVAAFARALAKPK